MGTGALRRLRCFPSSFLPEVPCRSPSRAGGFRCRNDNRERSFPDDPACPPSPESGHHHHISGKAGCRSPDRTLAAQSVRSDRPKAARRAIQDRLPRHARGRRRVRQWRGGTWYNDRSRRRKEGFESGNAAFRRGILRSIRFLLPYAANGGTHESFRRFPARAKITGHASNLRRCSGRAAPRTSEAAR